MQKKIFSAFIIIATLLTACNSNRSAITYNNDFVKKENSLVPQITKTENVVGEYFSANHFDSIAIAGKQMEQLIDGKLNEIKTTPAPDAKNAEAFKTACIKYFGFFKSIYTGYINFGNAKTDEERKEVLAYIQKLVSEKPAVLNEIRLAQKEFAAANNFKIENKN